jgi:hypothetical protein
MRPPLGALLTAGGARSSYGDFSPYLKLQSYWGGGIFTTSFSVKILPRCLREKYNIIMQPSSQSDLSVHMIWHKKKVERLSVNFHHFKKSCIEGSRLQTQLHSRLIFTVSLQARLLSSLSFTPDSSSQFHSRLLFSPDSSSLQTRLHYRLIFTPDSSSLQTYLHSRLIFTPDSASIQTVFRLKLGFTVLYSTYCTVYI